VRSFACSGSRVCCSLRTTKVLLISPLFFSFSNVRFSLPNLQSATRPLSNSW
jgi:hypothetical protein